MTLGPGVVRRAADPFGAAWRRWSRWACRCSPTWRPSLFGAADPLAAARRRARHRGRRRGRPVPADGAVAAGRPRRARAVPLGRRPGGDGRRRAAADRPAVACSALHHRRRPIREGLACRWISLPDPELWPAAACAWWTPGDRARPADRPAALATEAALLLDAVADRLTSLRPGRRRRAGEAAGADAGPLPECGTVPGASCTACPLCRFLACPAG